MDIRRILVLSSCLCLFTLTASIEVDPPKPFGTKIIYDWSFSDDEIIERNETALPAPSVCRPLYVGAFIRHGTRNPSDGDIEDAEALMNRIGGHILNPKFSHLNNYTFPFNIEEETQLVPVGYQENVGLGRRFASRLLELLGGANASEISLIASLRNRTQDSAKGFRDGLEQILGKFGDREIVVNNSLTRYYDECEKYVQEVDEDPDTVAEEEKFAAGPEMTGLAGTLSDRLQLDVADLTSGEIFNIFEMMTREEGILGGSNWTDLFNSTAELDILDYFEDFEAYYERGYAYPITYEMSCVVTERMFKEMDEAKSASQTNSSAHPKGTFMFGHSNSVVPLVCLLGLFKDSTLPILADNYDTQANRTFRASRIDPMAANVAFVLYECEEGDHGETPDADLEVDWPPTLEKYMVQLMFKEMSMKIPNTCGYDLCPYDEVRKHFEEYIDRCNFNERCALDDDDNDPSTAIQTAVSSIQIVILAFITVTVNVMFQRQ